MQIRPANPACPQSHEYLRSAGRGFGKVNELKIAVNRGVLIVDDPARIRTGDPSWPYHPLITTPEHIIEEFRRYKELGLYQVHCHFVARNEAGQREVLARFAQELRPEIER